MEVSREPSVSYFRAESQSPSVLWVALTRCGVQIGTTKGTDGDVLILEEAAYCDEGFFYETVAPILSISLETCRGCAGPPGPDLAKRDLNPRIPA